MIIFVYNIFKFKFYLFDNTNTDVILNVDIIKNRLCKNYYI